MGTPCTTTEFARGVGICAFGFFFLHAQAMMSRRRLGPTGMYSFVCTYLAHHTPHKRHPERTMKSYYFCESEGISREAKVAPIREQRAGATLSLQQDGIAVAVSGLSPGGLLYRLLLYLLYCLLY